MIRYAGRPDQDRNAFIGHTGKIFRQAFFLLWNFVVRTWYTMCFRENRLVIADLSESLWNLAFQPLKNISTTTMPMATTPTLGRVLTYYDGFPTIKSHDPLITWSYEITWQISPNTLPMATKLGRMVTYIPLWSSALKVRWPFDYVVFKDHVTN